jgi:phosphonate transport system permease protein
LNTDFAHYYQQIRSKQKRETLFWSLGLVALYLGAGSIAEFNLHTVWVSIPHFFDYLAETIPTLHWNLLFADGRTEGSLAYWGYRLNIQLPLIWETLQLALAATILSVLVAGALAFLAANNTHSPASLRLAIRTLVAFLRTMPELAWAVMFVMAFGIGAIPGFLALALHTIGSLTKLFYESIETASNKPVRGLTACGATPLQRMRFGLWPQVKPVFLSYSFMRLEINFRQSTILGLVGAGGIGQELMTNIKLDRYDQVSMTLLLIILVVSLLDYASGELRKRVVEGKNDHSTNAHGGRNAGAQAAASGNILAAASLPAHRRHHRGSDRAVLPVLLPVFSASPGRSSLTDAISLAAILCACSSGMISSTGRSCTISSRFSSPSASCSPGPLPLR